MRIIEYFEFIYFDIVNLKSAVDDKYVVIEINEKCPVELYSCIKEDIITFLDNQNTHIPTFVFDENNFDLFKNIVGITISDFDNMMRRHMQLYVSKIKSILPEVKCKLYIGENMNMYDNLCQDRIRIGNIKLVNCI